MKEIQKSVLYISFLGLAFMIFTANPICLFLVALFYEGIIVLQFIGTALLLDVIQKDEDEEELMKTLGSDIVHANILLLIDVLVIGMIVLTPILASSSAIFLLFLLIPRIILTAINIYLAKSIVKQNTK